MWERKLRRLLKTGSDVIGVFRFSRPPRSTVHLLDVFLPNVKIMDPENRVLQ